MTLTETCHLGVLSILDTKTLNPWRTLHLGKEKNIIKNVSFETF